MRVSWVSCYGVTGFRSVKTTVSSLNAVATLNSLRTLAAD